MCLGESHPCCCLSHSYQVAVFCDVCTLTLCLPWQVLLPRFVLSVTYEELAIGAMSIIVTESILCGVTVEAEERVEHGLHNVYSTTCFQQSDFGVEYRV